jgi:sodium/potassium-transporting ATPase subunit alpha
LASLLYISVPLPLPLSAILILVTDLGFEMFLALTYAWDVTENRNGLMKLEPRKPVTEKLIEQMKKDAIDGKPGVLTNFFRKWTNPIEEEVLVDEDVLSWAYLEAGMIETVGCFVCYYFAMWYSYGITITDTVNNGSIWGFSEVVLQNGNTLMIADQLEALAQGQSAFYLALLIQQLFNLFANKARLSLPYGKFMFQNPKTFYGLVLGTLFALGIVYIPQINVAFGTSYRTTAIVWPIAFAFGIVLFLYSTLRFIILRKLNPMKYAKEIDGLDLHPTRFSSHG